MSEILMTVAITLVTYWVIGFILASINEDYGVYWAVGLVFPLVYVVLYPVRAIRAYSDRKTYYKRNGISMLQYILGKRPE